jgi:hypothetical protein
MPFEAANLMSNWAHASKQEGGSGFCTHAMDRASLIFFHLFTTSWSSANGGLDVLAGLITCPKATPRQQILTALQRAAAAFSAMPSRHRHKLLAD